MLIDVTLKITSKMQLESLNKESKMSGGHLGTHLDNMGKEFPLEYTNREAVVFDVSHVTGRDIEISDIDMTAVRENMFVAFYSGFIEKHEYGGAVYWAEHPQLSRALIDALLEKKVSLIGIDFAGVRRGKEHNIMDQLCADHGVFIIENLWNLKAALGSCTMHTYPMKFAETTGLPCRIIAEKQ